MNKNRIIGYDIARSIAIFGMIWVHFRIVLQAGKNPEWLFGLAKICEGRASAIFVTLAGIGMSLMVKSSNDFFEKKEKQKILRKRALFLFVVGLCYFPIWNGDILHAYGVYIAIGATVLYSSKRQLCFLIFFVNLIFFILLCTVDFNTGWNWTTFTYLDFWTVEGMLRHIFYNGWNPVFPWLSFLFLGIIIGRLDVTKRKVRRKLFLFGTCIAISVEIISHFLVKYFTQEYLLKQYKISAEDIIAIFGTNSLPPLPLYILSAAGTAIAIIAICLSIGFYFSNFKCLTPIVSAGKLSLTVYIAHVVIGISILISLGWLETPQTLLLATTATIVFYAISVLFSFYWQKYFKQGPVEYCMRKITG